MAPGAAAEVRSTEEVVVAPEPDAPVGGADSRASRADSADSAAMVPHPRPPATPYIAPGARADISEADIAPGIDLGTLVPEPEAPYVPPTVQGP